MAVVTGHRATIMAALDDPVSAIHRPAVTAWLRSGVPTAGEVAAFVAEASWHTRRHVYRQLRRFRHLAVADELIDAGRERFGDEEAASLLTACSADVVVAGAPRAGLRGRQLVPARAGASRGGAERRRVAELADLPRPDRDRWWGRSGAGVLTAGVRISAARAGLAGALRPRGHLPAPWTATRCSRRPALCEWPGCWPSPAGNDGWRRRSCPVPCCGSLASLDAADLAPVAQRLRTRRSALVALLKAIPPGRRAALYDAAYAGMDRSQSRPSDADSGRTAQGPALGRGPARPGTRPCP